jgi:hypothetical protein
MLLLDNRRSTSLIATSTYSPQYPFRFKWSNTPCGSVLFKRPFMWGSVGTVLHGPITAVDETEVAMKNNTNFS